ncbi:MAG: DNA alkylation repair protein [Sulfurimonas sp.]|nr:DNA alkylation repair protein [Sulfurimonas sp.]
MSTLLKDLYNDRYIEVISSEIKNHFVDFKKKEFNKAVFDDDWSQKELKQRMRHISMSLGRFLPNKYENAVLILQKTFKNTDKKYRLENMIFQDFIEVYGLDNFETSIKALEVFTIESSSEFAIRKFIIKYPCATMKQMKKWALSKNEHLRRLASEGCRPRLPWAIALNEFKKNPKEVIEILELLKDDESEYVRKSVANNINDISKDNPNFSVELTKRWLNYSKNRDKLLKHGCRTLLKSRNYEVLKLFGLEPALHVEIINLSIEKSVKLGEELEFSFQLHSEQNLGLLRIEYQMEFLRQNNRYSKKMFKISESKIDKKNKKIVKKHSFRPISTRKYYTGEQRLSLVINGEIKQTLVFNLC